MMWTDNYSRTVNDAGASRQRQAGVALILALMVMAMASIAAAAMLSRQNLDVRRTANIMHTDQAYLYATAAEVFAKDVLIRFDETKDTDDRTDIWAQPLPPTPIEGGSIGGSIRDLNANFPLNMLVKADGSINNDYVKVLERLLQELGIQNHVEIAGNLADWIDKNDTSDKGMEDIDYLNLEKPYRTGNTGMASLSELRLIGGFDEKGVSIARILGTPVPKDEFAVQPENPLPVRNEPYVNVLPRGPGNDGEVAININTAPRELLLALHDRIKPEAVDAAIAERTGDENGSKPYKNLDKFYKKLADESNIQDEPNDAQGRPGIKHRINFINDMKKLKLDVKSRYFELTADAVIGESQLKMISLLERKQANNSEASVITLRRGLGEY